MTIKELPKIIRNAQSWFKELKVVYPVNGYLVFATNLGQAKIFESPAVILREFADFYLSSEALTLARDFLANLKLQEKQGKAIAKGSLENLEILLSQIPINPDCRIEIRFDDLDFELIKKLRADTGFVNTHLTPQIGGIRIAIGTLTDFA